MGIYLSWIYQLIIIIILLLLLFAMSHFDWATLKIILKYWTLCKNICWHPPQETIIEVPIIGNILGNTLGTWCEHMKKNSPWEGRGGGEGMGMEAYYYYYLFLITFPLCSQRCSHMFPIGSSSSQCVASSTSILSHIVWPQFFRPHPPI